MRGVVPDLGIKTRRTVEYWLDAAETSSGSFHTFDKAPDLWGGLTTAAVLPDTKSTPTATSKFVPRTPEQLQAEEQTKCQKEPANPFGTIDSAYCRARAYKVLVDSRSELVVRAITGGVFGTRRGIQTLLGTKVNPAIRSVKDAGSDLQNLLQENLIDNTKMRQALDLRLASTSVFLQGTNADWHFKEITDLRVTVEGQATQIAQTRLDIARTSSDISSRELELRTEITSAGDQLTKKTVTKSQVDAKVKADNEALVDLTEAKTTMLSDLNDLDYVSKETDKNLAALDDINDSSTKYTQFRDAKNELSRWRDRMIELRTDLDSKTDDAFSSEHGADCEFAFSQTKKQRSPLRGLT